ncbi:Uu.00g092270.m01.CDS01 [Anthostomella pinea]|uniref:Uu.00g092270.m01.CDS01 n=1 Tax=Anthostomella pinea TaxID=933095 RepID=A0AAI8YKB9_9PEZI|nr:Uu.00g092270.m01.CDS01 [Anthostomella pinea]
MAKPGLGKKKKAPSVHSRAARRATSPSINTDKSLKNVQPPADSVNHRPSVLAIHQGAGVSKKQKKGRQLTSKALRRQEKDQERAAAILERTQQKVAKSKDQSRVIQSRSKTWDEVNQQIPAGKSDPKQNTVGEEEWEDQGESEFDEEMGEADGGKPQEKTDVAVATSMDADDDAIL